MNRTLRVLHVVGGISWKYGGVTATILPMCDALMRRGVHVEIATTDADGRGERLSANAVPACSAPIRMFARDWSETWKVSSRLLAWLWRHVQDYDLVHIHSVWGFASHAAATAARRSGVPYVIFPQGMLSNYSWTRSAFRKRVYWRLIERKNVAKAARIQLTARGEAEEMRRLALPTPVTFTPLGLPDDAWTAKPDPGRLRILCRGKDRGRPIVLFLSRLHPKKGVADFLLPAFRALRSGAFLVVAGGPDPHAPGYFRAVQQEVKALGLPDSVAMLGPINPAERWAMYDGADAFVLPSRQENFGLVITEAMARGCPVVVSDRAYACEHVAAAEAGRVVPLRLDSLRDAVDEILSDLPAAREMGRRGADYARRNLSWDRIADSILEMYAGCMVGHSGPIPQGATVRASAGGVGD